MGAPELRPVFTPTGRKPIDRRPSRGDIAAAEAFDGGTITQDGVARVFADRYAGQLRYCHDTGAWFAWSGVHWERDETDSAFQYARELGREMTEGGKAKDLKEVRKVGFAAGVDRFARGDAKIKTTAKSWDCDPYLLGTPGGTVDLKTGRVRPADPNDCITKLTSVEPAACADCPAWIGFLDQAMGGDAGLIRFLQQFIGYSLTGDVREHALIFGYGPGGTGKSTFLNAITGIIADYATTAAMDTFAATSGDKHPTDLAMLRGARLVTASETEEGRAWAENRIKQITGGDPISARYMRQDFFTFLPQFKLFVVGNHKPILRNVDDAARRRFNIVPFIVKPPRPDRELEGRLRAERPAILRWAIDGCLDWQRNGLIRPQSVIEATAEYFSAQDLVGQWLEEECECDVGNTWRKERSGDLFASWVTFARNAGEQPGSQKALSETLGQRGFTKVKGAKGARFLQGIRLVREEANRGND